MKGRTKQKERNKAPREMEGALWLLIWRGSHLITTTFRAGWSPILTM